MKDRRATSVDLRSFAVKTDEKSEYVVDRAPIQLFLPVRRPRPRPVMESSYAAKTSDPCHPPLRDPLLQYRGRAVFERARSRPIEDWTSTPIPPPPY